MRLTLAEVVSEEEFGLVLRSGSPAALTRPVAGAETVEADRPEELTARDYIMFTTDLGKALLAAEVLDFGGVLVNEVPTWDDQRCAAHDMTESRQVVLSS